jgi:hypothetical protein
MAGPTMRLPLTSEGFAEDPVLLYSTAIALAAQGRRREALRRMGVPDQK